MKCSKNGVIANKPHALKNMDLIENRVISFIAIIGSKGVINVKGRLNLYLLVAVVFILVAGCASTQMPSLQKQCLDPNYELSGIGRTALMAAARSGQTDTVKTLLEQGADVKAKDNDGLTALMDAATAGQTDTVKTLLEQGADVNAKDIYGMTALMFAKGMGHAEIIQMLKKAGAK
jgi:hypothetical protein